VTNASTAALSVAARIGKACFFMVVYLLCACIMKKADMGDHGERLEEVWIFSEGG